MIRIWLDSSISSISRNINQMVKWFWCYIALHRLAPVVSAFFFFFFFLSFFITSCSCICLFNPISLFYYRNLSFPLRDITYQIILSCTRLYTFEKKRENETESGDRLSFTNWDFFFPTQSTFISPPKRMDHAMRNVSCLQVYVDRKDPDQPAILHSLIGVFAVVKRITEYYRLCTCAGWCKYAYFAHVWRQFLIDTVHCPYVVDP